MKKLIILLILTLICKRNFGQALKTLEVYYNDDQTVKGQNIYRPLKYIGDQPFWSKPQKLDIMLTFNNIKFGDNQVEILIEELYKPTSLAISTPETIKGKVWVPNQVIYSGNSNFIKSGRISIKDVAYQTAYYLDSLLYYKNGFRIVAIYYDKTTKKIERLIKSYIFPED